MATDETNFTQVFRGYDKEEVDSALQELRRELIKSNTQAAESAKEVKRLQARIDELNAEIEEVGSPTYTGLGTKLENTLRVAEEQSTRLIAQADIDAEKLRAGVSAEIDKVKKAAAAQAERILADAQARAITALEDAQIESARAARPHPGRQGDPPHRRDARGRGDPRGGRDRGGGGPGHQQARGRGRPRRGRPGGRRAQSGRDARGGGGPRRGGPARRTSWRRGARSS